MHTYDETRAIVQRCGMRGAHNEIMAASELEAILIYRMNGDELRAQLDDLCAAFDRWADDGGRAP